MREEYVEIDNGFTFKKVFDFMKKALPYIMVCLIITVMVGVACCGIMSEIEKKSNEKVQAIFELTYAGADEGLSPQKEQLDIQKIKSVGRITKVLSDLGLDYSPAAVQSAITINGHYSAEMRALIDALGGDENLALELIERIKFNPTQFIVNFNYKGVSGLSSNQAVVILEELLKLSKINDFAMSSTDGFMGSENYDDPKIADLSNLDKLYFLRSEILKVNAYIQGDSKMTAALKAVLTAGVKDSTRAVAEAENFILSNGTFIKGAVTLEAQIAQYAVIVSDYNNKIAVNNARIVDQKDSIDALIGSLQIIVNDKGEIINGGTYVTQLYNTAYSKYTELLDQKATLANELAYYTVQKTILENLKSTGFTVPTEENIIGADAKMELIVYSVKSLIVQIETFADGKMMSETTKFGMKTAMSPIHVFDAMFSPNWKKCILISAIIGILLGLIITCPLDKAIKRNATKKKGLLTVATDQANVDDTQENKSEQDNV